MVSCSISAVYSLLKVDFECVEAASQFELGGDFVLDAGEDNLSEYRFGTGVARHRFCRTCGVQAFYHPRSNPDGVAVTVHCLDPGSVSSVEVRKFDGTDWAGSYAATGIAACSKKA